MSLVIQGTRPKTAAAQLADKFSLAARIGSQFNGVRIRATDGRFSLIEGGEIHNLDGLSSIELEIQVLNINPNTVKAFYSKGYKEGSIGRDAAPDCSSYDGVFPDNNSKNPQSTTCSQCPQNQWGSAVNDVTGKDAKACSDGKRLAAWLIINGKVNSDTLTYMTLPYTSSKAFESYLGQLSVAGVAVIEVATKMKFDGKTVVFEASRFLSESEVNEALGYYESSEVAEIVGTIHKVIDGNAEVPVALPTSVKSLESKQDKPEEIATETKQESKPVQKKASKEKQPEPKKEEDDDLDDLMKEIDDMPDDVPF